MLEIEKYTRGEDMAVSKPGANHLAAAVMAVTAALGSYEALASEPNSIAPAFVSGRESSAPSLSMLESAHKDAMKKLRASTSKFTEINKSIMAKGFPPHMTTEEESKRLVMMMLGIRQIEAEVKKATVTGDSRQFHAELRRAVAELRSEIVVTFDMLRQVRGTPEQTAGRADMNGLKALAAHSTDRLLELASA